MAKVDVPTFNNFIGGRWTPPHSGATCVNRNPANVDDLIGVFPDSSAEDAVAAIEVARRTYDTWRLVPAPKRAEMLFRAAQLLVERKEPFAREMTREMGKVLEETRGDVQEAIDMTFYLAGEGRRMYGQTVPSELHDKFAMSIRQPLGVCSVITPWNFPMAIPSWKIIPALVCGNTVVFKPSELTPVSAHNFVRALEDAEVPPGVVNMVTGGPLIGELLTTHTAVSAVSFTGSTAVGRIVNQNAAPYFKKVPLEMISPSRDVCGADLARRGSVAPPRAAWSFTRPFTTGLSSSSWLGHGPFASATAATPKPRWGLSSVKSSSKR
jgi:alpha-ketoglutaric semialdehyde dehydrogenase